MNTPQSMKTLGTGCRRAGSLARCCLTAPSPPARKVTCTQHEMTGHEGQQEPMVRNRMSPRWKPGSMLPDSTTACTHYTDTYVAEHKTAAARCSTSCGAAAAHVTGKGVTQTQLLLWIVGRAAAGCCYQAPVLLGSGRTIELRHEAGWGGTAANSSQPQ